MVSQAQPKPSAESDHPARARRFSEQRWLLDNIIRANGVDWDQPRTTYLNAPCGIEANADFVAIRARVQKFADCSPAFQDAARRREARAKAAEDAGQKVTARENYFIAAVHWGAAQWPFDENNAENLACNERKRDCYGRYAKLADHHVEPVWIPFKGQALPAWFHLPAGYGGGRLPTVVTIPGMDSFKELSVAMHGDRWLNRGIAVLALDGPGQYESPVLGIHVSVPNWTATGGAVMDWLAARPEVDAQRVGVAGNSFGSLFSTLMVAHEPRFKACAVSAPCLEPGCHTIFEEASPTFKQRFMYMANFSDETAFDEFRQALSWRGHAERISDSLSLHHRRIRRTEPAGVCRADVSRHVGAAATCHLPRLPAWDWQCAVGHAGAIRADPGRGLDGGAARRRADGERALVRRRGRTGEQDGVVG